MSLDFFIGSCAIGLIFSLVALGVYISFRLLDFPDLTADGSFPLGGAVCGVCIYLGVDPWIGLLLGFIAGAIAGMITAFLFVKLNILQLLASIIVMIGLYSVNLRILGLGSYLDGSSPVFTGTSNLSLLGFDTIFTPFLFLGDENYAQCFVAFLIALIAVLLLIFFLNTQKGLALRATGTNLKMAKAQGIATDRITILGMAISNGLIALAGAIFIQTMGVADTSIGVGTIVIGLASIILGESLFRPKRLAAILFAVICGAIIYRLFIALVLSNDTLRSIGVDQGDTYLITSIILVLALILPKYLLKKYNFSLKKRKSL